MSHKKKDCRDIRKTSSTPPKPSFASDRVIRTNQDLQLGSLGKAGLTIVFTQCLLGSETDGPVVTLPTNPVVGERFTVVADTCSATVKGGTHAIECESEEGLFTEAGTAREFIYGPSGTWVLAAEVSHCLDSAFLTQTDWWINPNTGSNSNDGKTPARALKTYREFVRRISNGTYSILKIVVTVHLPVGLPPSDPIEGLLLIVDSGGSVRHVGGVKRVLYTGTITALTPQNHYTGLPVPLVAEYAGFGYDISAPPGPVGGQPWEITDAAIPNQALWFDTAEGLGQRLQITSGPNAGLIAYALKDLTSAGKPKTVRTSNWAFVSTFPDTFVTPGTPAVGNRFQIQELVKVTVGYNDVIVGVPDFSNPIFPSLNYENLNVVPQQEFGGFFGVPPSNEVRMYACKNNVGIGSSGALTMLNCMNLDLNAGAGGVLFLQAGALMFGEMNAEGGGGINPDGDFIIQSAGQTSARNGGYWHGGSFALFDSFALRSFLVSNMGLIQSSFGNPAVVWGYGNAYGCYVGANSEWFFVDLAVGNIRGGELFGPGFGSDFGIEFYGAFMDTSAKERMARAFDESQGANATYTDDRLCTWENLMVIPISEGGFRDAFTGSAALRPQSMSTVLWQRSF